tara:strand:+ start:38 stop:268 length:231 start_codon:yes stop_codon:yes gene_type:complete
MSYKVIPFTPLVSQGQTNDDIAAQIEGIISAQISNGYTFVNMQTITSDVAPTKGCFGFGGEPGYSVSLQVIIFKKN